MAKMGRPKKENKEVTKAVNIQVPVHVKELIPKLHTDTERSDTAVIIGLLLKEADSRGIKVKAKRLKLT